MGTYLHRLVPESSEQPSQKTGNYYNSKEGLYLESDVQRANMGVMVSCLHTYGHIVQFCITFYKYVEIIITHYYHIQSYRMQT